MKQYRDTIAQEVIGMGCYLHKRHHQILLDNYPLLTKPDLLMLTYILNRRRTTMGSRIPISAADVARFFRRNPEAKQTPNIAVMPTIEHLMDAIPGLQIEWTSYGKDTHRARDITHFILPERLAKLLYTEKGDDSRWVTGMIDVATGLTLTKKDFRRHFRDKEEALAVLNESPRYTWQKKFLAHLNGQDTRKFHISPESIAAARRYAMSLYAEPRDTAMANLEAIELFQKPLYRWVEDSARVFSDGYSLATIKSDIRRILLPDAYEVDLKQAQLAAFDHLLNVPELHAILESGESFWDHLLIALDLPVSDPVWRAAVKTATYSLCFGSGEKNLFNDACQNWKWRRQQRLYTDQQLKNLQLETSKRFRKIPVIKAMLSAREGLFKEMREGRVVLQDPYGKKYPLVGSGDKGTTDRSALAQVMQAWEQLLMEPVRQLAMNSEGTEHAVSILIYQHDGATLSFRRPDEAKSKLRELCAEVKRLAEQHGILTSLEIKYSPEVMQAAA